MDENATASLNARMSGWLGGHENEGAQNMVADAVQTAEQQRHMWATKLETQRAHQLLAASLDKLGVGLEIWDEQDRLVFCNKKNNRMHDDFYTACDIGQSFQTLLQDNLRRHHPDADESHKQAWIAERLAARAKPAHPQLEGLLGDRWTNTYETRTFEGYLVVARVDVTDLVRKGKDLEARNHQLAHQSATDGLTGLANRRCFDDVLSTEWQRAARSGSSLSFLMVDIDHFKNYNDHYGHLAGDECLRRVARVLGHSVRRAGEMVARYGGEEFVMLLPGADIAHACDTAQKCLERMAQEALPHAASPTAPHLTLSIGVACLLPDTSVEASKMVNAADAAMYRAKTGGRARFEVAGDSDWGIACDTSRSLPTH